MGIVKVRVLLMGRLRVRDAEGVVFTPAWLVDLMVEKLFSRRPPPPGLGIGSWIQAAGSGRLLTGF